MRQQVIPKKLSVYELKQNKKYVFAFDRSFDIRLLSNLRKALNPLGIQYVIMVGYPELKIYEETNESTNSNENTGENKP